VGRFVAGAQLGELLPEVRRQRGRQVAQNGVDAVALEAERSGVVAKTRITLFIEGNASVSISILEISVYRSGFIRNIVSPRREV
jgi:hypothetical protein